MARVVLQPLTRVEGHGRVELHLEDGRLREVRLALIESPRLFEKMVIGKSAAEVPDLVCRICAICSSVHKLAALAAFEQILAIEAPPVARLVRELLLLGGHIESHALHLFCLILPDFSSQRGIFDLLRAGDPLATAGIELKAFGNRLQELAGGRVIHPVNVLLGGVAGRPSPADLADLHHSCDRWRSRWPQLLKEFAGRARYPAGQPPVGTRLATGPGVDFGLAGDRLFLSGGRQLPVAEYNSLLAEERVVHSRAKHSCGPNGPFLVGALARRQLWCERSQSPSLPSTAGIHDNNTAQLEEIEWALARVDTVLATLHRLSPRQPLRTVPGAPQAGIGTVAFEAPRGLLVHHYVVDDWGQVAAADIVTPTAINQRAMEQQLLVDLSHLDEEAVLRDNAERIIRAFDPCISCAVHVIRA